MWKIVNGEKVAYRFSWGMWVVNHGKDLWFPATPEEVQRLSLERRYEI